MGVKYSRKAAPINEAVYLLNKLNPEALTKYKSNNPLIASELEPGIWAGENDEAETPGTTEKMSMERAKFVLESVGAALESAENGASKAAARISLSNKMKLYSSMLVIFGSSGILGALAIHAEVMAIAAALVTFVSSVASIISDHLEKILNPISGNIRDAHTKFVDYSIELGQIRTELDLSIRYNVGSDDLDKVVSAANSKINAINKLFPQLYENWS